MCILTGVLNTPLKHRVTRRTDTYNVEKKTNNKLSTLFSFHLTNNLHKKKIQVDFTEVPYVHI